MKQNMLMHTISYQRVTVLKKVQQLQDSLATQQRICTLAHKSDKNITQASYEVNVNC